MKTKTKEIEKTPTSMTPKTVEAQVVSTNANECKCFIAQYAKAIKHGEMKVNEAKTKLQALFPDKTRSQIKVELDKHLLIKVNEVTGARTFLSRVSTPKIDVKNGVLIETITTRTETPLTIEQLAKAKELQDQFAKASLTLARSYMTIENRKSE